MNEAQRLTCDELGDLLQQHLGGTALEGLAKNRSYITDAEGLVARETINSLCRALSHAVHVYEIADDMKKLRQMRREKIERAIHRIFETVNMYFPEVLEWIDKMIPPSMTEREPQEQPLDLNLLERVGQIRNAMAAIEPFGTQLQESPSH